MLVLETRSLTNSLCTQVMREWIRFGAVVLVVDYFLELTFFSTVLSIDIQRLEVRPPSFRARAQGTRSC